MRVNDNALDKQEVDRMLLAFKLANNNTVCERRQRSGPCGLYDVPYVSTSTLDEWSPVSTDEVEKFISSALSKTCQLEPAPTWLVKDMGGLL